MHVLQLSIEYPPEVEGGLSTHLELLNAELCRLGVRVTVIALSTRAQSPPSRVDGRVHVHWCRPPSFSWQRYGEVLAHPQSTSDGRRLLGEIVEFTESIIKASRPDLIHVHSPHLGEAAIHAAANARLPLVWTAHSSASLPSLYGDMPFPYLVQQECSLLDQCEAVIVPSLAMRQLLTELYRAASGQIFAVHNGMDEASFAASADARIVEQLRSQIAPGGGPIILYVGRMTKAKGLIELIRSVPEVISSFPRARYLLIGSSTERPFDESSPPADVDVQTVLAGEMAGLPVRHIGFLPRTALASYYAACDLAVVPSLFEPFGYAALEAMALGKPVVASSNGGLSEIVRDGVDGVLVPVQTELGRVRLRAADLANAQRQMLGDLERAAELGRNGKARAREFSARGMAEGTKRIYERVFRVAREARP